MFVARERETKILNDFLKENKALLIYGLRRVGKTTLIKNVLKNSEKNYVYFECLKADERTNVSLFVNLLKEQIGFIDAKFEDFLSVFKLLNRDYKDYVFVIDEYSYLKQYYLESKKSETKLIAEKIDSEFQNIIDNYLDNIHLIMSGSSIHIMDKLQDHNCPLYGRFYKSLCLKPFNYLEAYELFTGVLKKEYISYYSVFGGSPYVIEKVDPDKTLKENICELLLDEDGILRNHIKHNVLNELEQDPDLNNVLSAIKNGIKRYGDIENICQIKTPGLLDKRLKKLIDLDIIDVKYSIGKENDKKKKYYYIKDNLLKFYYAYIYREENRINYLSSERYYDLYIAKSINEFISLRFENIVRDYFSIAIRKGMYEEIIDIGSLFTQNGEFDCVIKNKNNKYMIYEVKYLNKPLKIEDMKKEIYQIKNIKGLKVEKVGFVSSSGFAEKLPDVEYLNLNSLFFEEN